MHLFRTRRRRFIFLAAFLIVASISVRLPFYKGNGQLKNNTLFAWGSRYELVFDSFTFEGETVKKAYSFVGLPRENYTFQLNVLPDLSSNKRFKKFLPILAILEDATVEAELKLSSDRTNIHVKKSPLHGWVVSSWNLWRTEFNRIKLSKRDKYQLELTISSKTHVSEPVTFQPTLLGGMRNVVL